MKRVNARSGHLIDHNLEDLMDVPIQLSLPLSLPSLFEKDYASMDATNGTPIDFSPSWPIKLVDPKQDESKKGYYTAHPSTVEQVHKLIAPFSNGLKNKKDHIHADKIRETFSQVKISIPLLDAI